MKYRFRLGYAHHKGLVELPESNLGGKQTVWWSCRESNPGGSGGAAARVR